MNIKDQFAEAHHDTSHIAMPRRNHNHQHMLVEKVWTTPSNKQELRTILHFWTASQSRKPRLPQEEYSPRNNEIDQKEPNPPGGNRSQ
jgi:hypothetical protein